MSNANKDPNSTVRFMSLSLINPSLTDVIWSKELHYVARLLKINTGHSKTHKVRFEHKLMHDVMDLPFRLDISS